MVKAPSTSTHCSDTTLLDARHFSDCAAHSRGPSMALQSSKHWSGPAIDPSAKRTLPNTASSAQHSLSPRTATRPSHVLGASRSLGDTEMPCSLRPPTSLFLPVCTQQCPLWCLAYTLLLPIKHDSSRPQARMYRRHLPSRTRGTGRSRYLWQSCLTQDP